MFIKTKQKEGIEYYISEDPFGLIDVNTLDDRFKYQLYISTESEKYYLATRCWDTERSKTIYYMYFEDIEQRSDTEKIFIGIDADNITDEVIDLLVQFRNDFPR